MITIYTLCWQESFMLPHFIKWYRDRFSDCHIVVYDNESKDDSREIALAHGCEVRTFTTNNTLSDRTYLDIKNNCWKDAKTDWVLIADVDEHLDISYADLCQEITRGTTMILAEGWNMVSMNDAMQGPFDLFHGVRAPSYDKLYCFDKKRVQEINYQYGCHRANPIGGICLSINTYKCRHYKYLNLDYMIKRHAQFAKRLSEHNKKYNLGTHYLYTPAEITKEFNEARKKAVIV